MELPYSNFENCLLFNVLKNNYELKRAIVYSLIFKEFDDLKLSALEHSMLLYNDEIAVYIILYVGFENQEYLENRLLNSYFISFERTTNSMNEFKDVDVIYLDKAALVHTAIALSKIEILEDFKLFINN